MNYISQIQIPQGCYNAIPTFFGNGVIGQSVTGLIRIPAFLASLTGAMIVGELAIRVLSGTLSTIGLKPDDAGIIGRSANAISESGIRPFRDQSIKQLVIKAVAFCALGIIGTEAVRILGGAVPPIYNTVLTYLGPIRIDGSSYANVIASVVRR